MENIAKNIQGIQGFIRIFSTDDKEDSSPEEIQRLKFITTTTTVKKQLEDAQKQLQMVDMS